MSTLDVIALLEDIQRILEKASSKSWASTIAFQKERLQAALNSGSPKWTCDELETIKELYGGMGSFSDINLTPKAGDSINPEDVDTVNTIFHGLQSRLYEEIEKQLRALHRTNSTSQ